MPAGWQSSLPSSILARRRCDFCSPRSFRARAIGCWSRREFPLGSAPGDPASCLVTRSTRRCGRCTGFSRYSKDAWGPRVVAVATSAVREARNRERLLGPLRRREGIDVRVLSARDEARFGVYAALDSLSFKDGVVADLGGASFQLSRVRDRKVVSIASVPLGAVRTSSLFLRHERPRPRSSRRFALGFARSSRTLCLRPVAAR